MADRYDVHSYLIVGIAVMLRPFWLAWRWFKKRRTDGVDVPVKGQQ